MLLRKLTVAAAAHAAQAALLVQPELLPLSSEKPPVPKLTQYAGPLHGGLEPLEKYLWVLALAK